jgi:mRNA-degrading endonuclease HigB of HigAB toxin-antitoxin module
VVFNIEANDYRLVAAINYRLQITSIKWIGNAQLIKPTSNPG